jgi:DNA-binding response OmpR family regulator
MAESTASETPVRAIVVTNRSELVELQSLLTPCGVAAELVAVSRFQPEQARAPALAVLDQFDEDDGTIRSVRTLRDSGARVVMLNGASSPAHVCDLYRAGADVVFDHSIDCYHLFLQCCALLQIWHPETRPARIGVASFDADNRRLVLDDRIVRLTEAESRILGLLIDSRAGYVSRESISQSVFRIPYDRFDRRIDVHMSNLRKKLRENAIGAAIDTSRRNGFRIAPISSPGISGELQAAV